MVRNARLSALRVAVRHGHVCARSIGDVNAHRVGQCQVTLRQLEHYVYRRA